MNTKSYLRIDGINGIDAIYIGSEEPVRLGDIAVTEVSWGSPTFTKGITSSPPSGSPTNQVGFLNVMKSSDTATNPLRKALASGHHFSTMLLMVDRDPYGYAPFVIYEMTDVVVFGMANQVDSSGEMSDAITFKFNASKPPRVASSSSMDKR